MEDDEMERVNLKCTYCQCQDFQVDISVIPSGVSLSCNKCGRVTPIMVFKDGLSGMIGINGKHTKELYEESYCEKITMDMLITANAADLKECENEK